MISSAVVTVALFFSLGFYFLLAVWGERLAARGRNPANNGVVYGLSLAVYASTWTFYGSIGNAVSSGPLYLSIYLGPTLGAILWWEILRRLIRLKQRYGLTSVADLLSVRYNKSQMVGGLVALCCLIGIIPYIALQLKAIRSTFHIVTNGSPFSDGSDLISIGVTLLLTLFIILFGVRRLDATERHQGMVVAVAFESVFKLVAFLVVGAFIVFWVFDGFGDIATRSAALAEQPLATGADRPFATWLSYMLLAMAAFLLLPRQFHVAVVENYNERHIRTAMWLLPLYLLLINIFVSPIAQSGLLLGLQQGDTFLLAIPILEQQPLLALLVFIGGFAAGTSMITVSVVALATMATNHLYLPIVDILGSMQMRRNLLYARWVSVALILISAYFFELFIGRSQSLIFLGVISFAAVYQFLPAVLGALFWKGGSRTGALLGISAGFSVWVYTLLLPTFVLGGMLPSTLVELGPFHLNWLRPTALFGIHGLDLISHCVLWSTLFNCGFYVLGSFLRPPGQVEILEADSFINILQSAIEPHEADYYSTKVTLEEKLPLLQSIVEQYFPASRANNMLLDCMLETHISLEQEKISLLSLTELCSCLEKRMAGSIGTAGAHRAMQDAQIFSNEEKHELGKAYGGILAELQLTPIELHTRINYYKERESLQLRHAEELQEKVEALYAEMDHRREAEEALRTSEERYRLLLDALPVGILIHSNGKIRYANSTAVRLIGFAQKQRIVGHNIMEFIHPEDRKMVAGRLAEMNTQKAVLPPAEIKYICADGHTLFTQTISVAMYYQGEHSVVTILVDLTEQRQALEARLLLSSAVEQAAELMIIMNRSGQIQYVNPAFAASTGFAADKVVGTHIRDLHIARFNEIFNAACSSGQSRQEQLNITKKDGSVLVTDLMMSPIQDQGEIRYLVAVLRDITSEESLRRQLRQSQKMEAIGTLAGGIAHDFNNILFVITGNADLALNQVEQRHPVHKKLSAIKEAGQRARDLVKQILSFSRYSDANRQVIDISPVTRDVISMLQAALPKTITINLDDRLDSRGLVLAEPTEYEQILMNLCTNAGHAMTAGGTLDILMSLVEVDADLVKAHPNLSPGSHVHLSVRDNGVGIGPDLLDRVFEPFFTTKAQGEGTGLGLAVVHGIVTSLGGEISVSSTLGEGSVFNIFLPCQTRVALPQEASKAGLAQGEGEHVLVVDDEPGVLALLSDMLEALEYRATCFKSSREALEHFRRYPYSYDLVFTDQTMPGLTGVELARAILAIRPDIPVVLCTGYSQMIDTEVSRDIGIKEFLHKPLLFEDLSRVLNTLLDPDNNALSGH